jgi:hypothetical protein
VANHLNLRFWPAFPATWDKARDAESARKLRELDPKLLVVGHNPPVTDPLPAMDRAVSRTVGASTPTGASVSG